MKDPNLHLKTNKWLGVRLSRGGSLQMIGLGAPEPRSRKSPVINDRGSYDEAGYHAILSPETRERLRTIREPK